LPKAWKSKEKTEDLIRTWHQEKFKNFDIGKIHDFDDAHFFLESFGFGVFPYLMMQMKKLGKEKIEDPDEKIKAALQVLHEIIFSYDAKDCQLNIDGRDHSGKYLLAEIMNTKSIGPNLFLAPKADPGDGLFNMIVIPEADREKFASYVMGKINNKEEDYDFLEVQGKKVSICWDGTHVHVDDEVVKLKKKKEIKVEIKKNLFRFLVP
jgi:diacylglycerol kinase family enzyme